MREVKLFTPKKIIKKKYVPDHVACFLVGPYNDRRLTGTVDYIDKCFEKRTGIELRSVCQTVSPLLLHYCAFGVRGGVF